MEDYIKYRGFFQHVKLFRTKVAHVCLIGSESLFNPSFTFSATFHLHSYKYCTSLNYVFITKVTSYFTDYDADAASEPK